MLNLHCQMTFCQIRVFPVTFLLRHLLRGLDHLSYLRRDLVKMYGENTRNGDGRHGELIGGTTRTDFVCGRITILHQHRHQQQQQQQQRHIFPLTMNMSKTTFHFCSIKQKYQRRNKINTTGNGVMERK